MQISFHDHPARHRDSAGELVPAVPDQRMIRIDGQHSGYCGIKAGRPVTMTRFYNKEQLERVREVVAYTYGEPSSVSAPPDPRRYDR